MFERNEMTNVVRRISFSKPIVSYTDDIFDSALSLKRLNSYIVYATYGDKRVSEIEIHYNVSQISKFNTLKGIDVANTISSAIDKLLLQDERPKVVCHGQADLTSLIKQFKPLIVKLAKEQKQRWQYLEMEDLIQMCNLVICDLYYKGYYIHKRLVFRAFNNYVLMHIRKDKSRPEIISLEQEYAKSDDDNKLTVKDMVPDIKALNEQEDKENFEVERRILADMKDIVLDIIGPRQYDQMLREYSNGQTTNWSRKLMQTIKAKLYDLGINAKSFKKYYN